MRVGGLHTHAHANATRTGTRTHEPTQGSERRRQTKTNGTKTTTIAQPQRVLHTDWRSTQPCITVCPKPCNTTHPKRTKAQAVPPLATTSGQQHKLVASRRDCIIVAPRRRFVSCCSTNHQPTNTNKSNQRVVFVLSCWWSLAVEGLVVRAVACRLQPQSWNRRKATS